MTNDSLKERFKKLGLVCEDVPFDRLSSPLYTLSCIPMYMVANIHGWTEDEQFKVPVLDIQGSEAFREAFIIGAELAEFEIEDEHMKVLDGLLTSARPADIIIYEYALETMRLFLEKATPSIAEKIRTNLARMILNVADASGKGFLGTGKRITAQEQACIDNIMQSLDLKKAGEAS